MVETVTTLVSLLLSAGAGGVIVNCLIEERVALRRALAGIGHVGQGPLPARTQRVAGPRPARFIRLEAAPVRWRAAA